MANNVSNKFANSKNVVYDSVTDTSSGRKRAVQTGGASVAERARLFGTQINLPSASKSSKPQQSLVNNQPSKPRIVHEDRNYEPIVREEKNYEPPKSNIAREEKKYEPPKSNIAREDRNYQPYRSNVDRYPKQDTSYSASQRPPNSFRPPPIQSYDRPPPVQSYDRPPPVQNYDRSKTEQPRNYSSVIRPKIRQQQPPVPNYDTFQSNTSQQQQQQPMYPQTMSSGEIYTSEDEDNTYYESYEREQRSSPIRNLNYFQPIQDPLEALYKNATQGYYQQPKQQQIPPSLNTTSNDLQPFDLGNLINRIQEDYVNNARPYVSSIQFIQTEQNLANMGLITPSTNRKDYTRRNNDNYQKHRSSYYYDVIDMKNGLYPTYTKQFYNHNNYSSIKRTKQRSHYHDRASSPISIPEPVKNPPKPKTPPTPKAPTPVVVTESESEEEETAATNTQAETSKTTETSNTTESEEESSEKPAPVPIITPVTARPPLPNQTPTSIARTPVKSVTSESSESEESDSDSESETETEEEKVVQPKQLPPITRSTPQTSARRIPQRTSIDTNNTTNQYDEHSNSADVEAPQKSSVIGSKFKSITNKFRRKKSS